jgi:fructosamine-3-kinase
LLSNENVKDFISKSLGLEINSVVEIHEIRDRVGREVIDCLYRVGDNTEERILKVYHKGFDDDSELGVVNVARKVQLASIELVAHSIKIPRVFGSYRSDDVACIVMEKLEQTNWNAGTRVEAAEILARLHNVSPDSLSDDFQRLIRDSKQNRDRGWLGVIGRSRFLDKKYPRWRKEYPELSNSATEISKSVEPVSSMTTLVHGDYFSVNLIPTSNGLCVIDWDLLSLGDPTWDLGMLVGADDGIGEKEIEDVVRAYQRTRPVDEEVFHWQLKCWNTLRGLIKLMDKYRNL